MHLPYIRKIFGERGIDLVPIMVGNLSDEQEREYGIKLSRYLADKETLFIVSSDFCHWGANFDYYPYEKQHGEIWQSVEAMDRQGMSLIEANDIEGFSSYLKKTQNTICGRHPIGVFMNAAAEVGGFQTRFTHYD